MDVCAEFSLQVARFAQERASPLRSPARWHLLPGDGPLTWADARSALSALPKPMILAPLNEPGTLGIWLATMFDERTRAWFDRQMASQRRYWDEKLKVCGVSETGSVVFAPATPALRLSAEEFRRWASEYALALPVTMHASEGQTGRFLIMPPGGDGPPQGEHDPYAPAS